MKRREWQEDKSDMEIDLKPFINFLVVMIPVLMISAEFSKIAIVEASASISGVQVNTPGQRDYDDKALKLTLLVSDSAVTVGSRAGLLPSVRYREVHTYVSREDRNMVVSAVVGQRAPVVNPANGKTFGVDERHSIDLYTLDDRGAEVRCLYTKRGELLTGMDGSPLAEVKPGDTVVIPGQGSITVRSPGKYVIRPLSVYDDLRAKLSWLRERAEGAPDIGSVCIAADSSVCYDKVIQLMDVARSAGFPEISIGKLRGSR